MKPPPLWALLLVSNLAVLALPVSGLWAMRLYESALVRQTESELEAQAAVWAAAYRQELRRIDPDQALTPPTDPVSEVAANLLRRPGLDLAIDPVLPPPPDPSSATKKADPRAVAVGQALAPMLRDARALTLSALQLTDPQGVIVASTGTDIGQSLARWPEVAAVIAAAPVASAMHRREPVNAPFASISRTSRLRVFVAMPVAGRDGIAGIVVLSRTPRDAIQAIWGKRWALTELAALLLAAGVLLAAGLARLVTRPIAQVVEQAQRAALGNQVDPLLRPGTKEVAALSAALTRMAATLDQRARYIIAFAASVSHEFKTPLSGLRGAAELLDDHFDTLPPEERQRLLAVVTSTTQRLDQLVRRLLDLARADMTRPGQSATTSVAAVLAQLLPLYPDLRINARVDNETVALPEDALAAIFASLLDNAAAHAGAGTTVTITVTKSRDDVDIVVADNGPGISPANRDKIFEPFFTTARQTGGTGLGLSIVRAITTGTGGSVELLDHDPGAHVRVRLQAPSDQNRDVFKTKKSFFASKNHGRVKPDPASRA